ncbi:hypothetical protein PN36_15045 [Candidatus Thiomargarita nelsonii]|uniref:Uncharacterized protein n=1 Tax=Candidatus Thiomargarita nelsonii TaxID=1003181 RepID=A0A4E0QQ60_9GAMM|nr:hypothetical protein PN36_15045 [Candidatus Thiomargarita nelsonii]
MIFVQSFCSISKLVLFEFTILDTVIICKASERRVRTPHKSRRTVTPLPRCVGRTLRLLGSYVQTIPHNVTPTELKVARQEDLPLDSNFLTFY